MELKTPKRKRRPRDCPTPQPSFPVATESRTGIPANLANWQVYTGRYNGDCVVIDDREEMARINSQGYFGKGSLSRNFPKFDRITRGIPPFIRERQWQRRCKWANIVQTSKNEPSHNVRNDQGVAESLDSPQVAPASAKKAISDSQDQSQIELKTVIHDKMLPVSESGRDVVVLNDSDSECDDGSYILNLKPRIEKEPCSIYETLHLTLEEAFFLSYGLGCLKVFDLFGNNIPLIKMWRLFIESQKDFVEMYVVYHYFRAKGWIVKPGLKFGGDFVLYKQGPPHYHASYIVKVQIINEEERFKTSSENISNPMKSWTRLMGLNRLVETAAKELLLCHVVWPSELSKSDLDSPTVLSRFSVYEVLVRRWVAARERDNEEDEL